MKFFYSFCILVFFSSNVFSQLTVTSGLSPTTLVQNTLIGSGVTVSNISYTGSPNAIGRFQTGPIPTNLGVGSGVIMSTGNVNGSPQIGSPVASFASTGLSMPGDVTLNALGLGATFDATVLEFDFVPLSDTVRFRYVFASEEYPEFVNSTFNDVFGFFVSGLNPLGGNYNNYNIARLPITNQVVSINTVNHLVNTFYYVNNQAIGGTSIVFDGFTTVLTAWINVIPCTPYRIKLAIADVADGIYDSAVFLEANSFSSPEVSGSVNFTVPGAGTAMVEGCNNAIVRFCIEYPLSTPYNIPIQVTGTALPNIDYTATLINFTTNPPHIQMPAGDTCINVVLTPLVDGLAEGVENIIIRYRTHQCSPVHEIIIQLHNYTPLTISNLNDTLICKGDSIPIFVTPDGRPPYNYVWNQGLGNDSLHIIQPFFTTTYHVTVTDACGFSASDSMVVEVEAPNVDAGIDVSICEGDSVTLTASGWHSLTWSTNDTIPSIVVAPTTTTTYYVTSNSVCFSQDSVTVTVNPNPDLSITPDASICHSRTLNLQVSGADTYFWTSDPTDLTIVPQQTLPNIIVTPSVTTTYQVVGITFYGCIDSIQTTVSVYPQPVADFSADRFAVSSFDPIINFVDLSTGNPTIWNWNFGDGNTSNIQNPAHDYGDTGGYFDVKLVVTTDQNCSDSIIKPVYVRPDHVLYVPNAFLPGNPHGTNTLIWMNQPVCLKIILNG